MYKLFAQLVRGEHISTREAEEDFETGKSLPFLPLWRGLASRAQEIAERKGESVVTVTEFIELLPGHEQGYDERHKNCACR